LDLQHDGVVLYGGEFLRQGFAYAQSREREVEGQQLAGG
jgi:hypothetical protein